VPVHVGTSGWQYRDWRGPVYPHGLRQTEWLGFYAQHFSTVEVNNAFYRLPEADVFRRWAENTPDGFVVAVKASRYLTHIRRLKDPAEPVQRLVERASGLGPKLGPMLLQLPPTLAAQLTDLAATLGAFPPSIKVAVEFRHPSWYTEETAAVLAEHDAAFCLADTPRIRTPDWRTATWGYLRMHEGRASPRPCYGRQALRSWAGRLAELFESTEEVFVYFNNDTHACAVANARQFRRLCGGD